MFGGTWYSSTTAGAFSWALNSANSSVSRTIGARVAFTPPLYANFTYNNATSTVAFTDTSYNISTRTGLVTSPTSWNWSFGDGSLSTSQNPTHAYAPGTYMVNLTVSDGTNYATSLQQVIQNNIVASFTPTGPISTTFPTCTAFADASTGSPTAWNWTAQNVTGNNVPFTFNTSQNPLFCPPTVGNFSISLNASTSTSYNISAQVTWVNVSSGAPVALMSPWPLWSAWDPMVNLTDSSTNTPTNCTISWGDSVTEYNCNTYVMHQYQMSGIYPLDLTVTNAGGSSTNRSWIQILE